MKRILSIILIISIISVPFLSYASETVPLQLFVATDGNDEIGDGSIENPFATPMRATEEIRKIKEESGIPENGIIVNLREGTYYVDKTWELKKGKDDGEEGNPIIYRSYLNEKAEISGLYKLDISKFKDVKNTAILKKLPKNASSKVKQMDLSDIPVDLGKIGFLGRTGHGDHLWSDLILNDERATWARYPNSDYDMLYPDEIVANGANGEPQSFYATDEMIDQIRDEKDLWMYEWVCGHGYEAKLSEFTVEDDGLIQFTEHVQGAAGQTGIALQSYPFFFVNSPYFIDTEGEYFIDRDEKILYFYPPNQEDYTLHLTNLKTNVFSIEASNIEIRNIVFSGSQMYVGGIGGTNITLDGFTIRNSGFGGLGISNTEKKPINVTIKNGKIYDIGNMGINYVNGGDLENLISGNLSIYNNEVYHIGAKAPYHSTLIWCSSNGYGAYVGYNYIHDMYNHVATLITDGVFEHNDVENASIYGDDHGAIYWGGHYKERGRKLHYNYIHDIKCFNERRTHGNHGIYLDGSTDVEVTHNVVADVEDLLYLSSSSGLHTLKNNIFVGSEVKYGTSQTIAVTNGGLSLWNADTCKSTLQEYMYTSDKWYEKFPEIKDYLELGSPCVPDHKITENLLVNCQSMQIDSAVYEGDFTEIKNNWETDKDPGFVDLKNGNYQLKEDAAVFKKIPGFEMIDMNKIGRVTDNVARKIGNSLVLRINSAIAMQGMEKTLVDESNAEVKPFIENSRTLVPVRFISEAFGLKVDWNEAERKVTLSGDKNVEMVLDKNDITVDGVTTQMDTAAVSVNGRTFIPLRAIAEAIGKNVFWDARGLIIISDKADIFDTEYDANEITYLYDNINMY